MIVVLAIPLIQNNLKSGYDTNALINEKQIHLATFAMSTDRISTGDKSIGWPGDLVASGTMPRTVSDFIKVIVKNDYLKIGNLKVFAAPEVTPFTGLDINQFSPTNHCGYTIYCAQEEDASNAIFLSTRNATLNVSNTTFSLKAIRVPYGDKGYVIFRRGGDGAILTKNQASIPTLQGSPCKMALSGTAALQAK